MGIKMNDQVGSYFQTLKRVLGRVIHCLPCSLISLQICWQSVSRAKEHGQVKGVVPNLIDGGLSILQYAYDTIIFIDHDIEQAENLKLLLCVFEQLSSLKINFHKK